MLFNTGYGEVLKSCVEMIFFFLTSYFRNISKTVETINLIKKFELIHGVPVYNKR